MALSFIGSLVAREQVHPGMEFSYMLSGTGRTPRCTLLAKQIPSLRSTLLKLSPGDLGYWDDRALAQLLYGVCVRYVVYPDPETVETRRELCEINAMQATSPVASDALPKEAEQSFKWIIEHGTNIEWDHHLVYCAHLELGKLYACLGNKAEAKRHLELVASGKPLEVNAAGRKGGKYSMQNAIQIKSMAAMEALEIGRCA